MCSAPDAEIQGTMDVSATAEAYQLQVNGKAANVAQGDVKVDHQVNDMKKQHNAQQQLNIYFNQPKEDSARYIQRCHPDGFGPGPEIAYDRRYRSHVRWEDSRLLTNQINASWEKSRSVGEELRVSIDKFDREVLKGGAKGSENLSSLDKSFDGAVSWFNLTLKSASRLSSDVRIRKRVMTAFVDLEQYIPSFFDWVRTLSNHLDQRQCSSLCCKPPHGLLVTSINQLLKQIHSAAWYQLSSRMVSTWTLHSSSLSGILYGTSNMLRTIETYASRKV
ncbi:hypothetical protein ANO14919_100790 [Xylariales sp. No.14919]|nr:hypothetical protein ANO14919_100790 [Xylariales sp. No.14919]